MTCGRGPCLRAKKRSARLLERAWKNVSKRVRHIPALAKTLSHERGDREARVAALPVLEFELSSKQVS